MRIKEVWLYPTTQPPRCAQAPTIMAKKFPIHPKNPQRICWGCDKYCNANDLLCGNGSERIQHPIELDGDNWYQKGDWHNLLSEAQMIELGLMPTPKPHIKLPLKKNHN